MTTATAPPRKTRAAPRIPLQTAAPPELDLPRDTLKATVAFYSESVTITLHDDKDPGTARVVSALDLARTLAGSLALNTGILPPDTLWWAAATPSPLVALWRPPRVWKVAVQMAALEPPQRYQVPMPGLLFLCQAGQPPYVWAAKKRPVREGDKLYVFPGYNVWSHGLSCQGSHKYPQRVEEIPKSFFLAFFSPAEGQGRSKKYPQDVGALWRELDGKTRFPLNDLVEWGDVARVMEGRLRR